MSDVERTIRQMQSEIDYLHRLLDEHGIKYSVSFENEEQLPKPENDQGKRIIHPEITPEMAQFFYTYFRGRKDVYSKRAKLKNGGSAYFPVCNNFWRYRVCPKVDRKKIRCQDCANQNYKELSIVALMDHLNGGKADCSDVIGLYPLFPDDTCCFLVFDFDDHGNKKEVGEFDEGANQGDDWVAEVNAMRRICREYGIEVLVERSRSGHGAHIWIFFDSPIPAQKARQFGSALLTKGAEKVNLSNFKSYDRMIPMQDQLPEGGFGNLIALPLQGQALANGNSAFIDDDWNAIPDQWTAIKNTAKLSLEFVEQKIQEWTDGSSVLGALAEDIDIDEPDGELAIRRPWERKDLQFAKEDVAGTVQITLANGIYIDQTNLKARIRNQMRRLAAYSNPEFYKKQALGYSTHDTPRIVYCGSDVEEYIHLPRGCYETLINTLKQSEIPYRVQDERQKGRKIDVSFTGELYPEQREATDKMLRYDNGILSAATAFGKTVVGAYLIAAKKTNTLILVRNTEILKNWQEDLAKFLKINEDPPTYTTPSGRTKQRNSAIGRLQASHNSLTGIVDIAMITSLGKSDTINPLVRDYGLVLMDECHHAGAYTDETVLQEVSAKTVYGLTATPKRDDGQDKKIFMQFGPIRYRYTARDRAKKQGIGHYIYPRFTRLVDTDDRKPSMAELNQLVIDSETRNEQIISDTIFCVQEGRTPLVMTKYKGHAQYLYDRLRGEAEHVFLLQGGRSNREKDDVRRRMNEVPGDQSMIVVAIGKYIGEGFNYPRLDTLLLAMPISWQGNVEQYAGRLNRNYSGKEEVIIFDYIDAHVPILERMYHKRLRAYRQIGFEVKTDFTQQNTVSQSIFDLGSYKNIYEMDLSTSKREVVISSPRLNRAKAKRLISLLERKQEDGVKITILTLPPDSYSGGGAESNLKTISLLQMAGISVRCSANCREHFAIIDREICWYGSMNLLSTEKEEDNLMRVKSKIIAEELLEIGMDAFVG